MMLVVEGRENKHIEVRNICKTGYAYFSPSTATGKGRFFCQEDHDRKLNAIDSYVFCDLRDRFVTPPKFYEIPVTKVLELQECGIIKEGKVCLLYTSPSPRDPKSSRMPSSA